MSIFNSLEGDLLSKLAKQTPLSTIYRKYSESLIIINSFWKVNQVVSTRFTKIKKVSNLNGTQHRDRSRSRTPATSNMESSLMLQESYIHICSDL